MTVWKRWGAYEVSDDGLVMNEWGKIMKPRLNNRGYDTLKVCSSGARNWVFVHRLVAKCFVSNPDELPFVDHVNGDKRDNAASNLRWSTPSQNTCNAVATCCGTSRFKGVSWSTQYNAWRAAIVKDGVHYFLGHHANEIDAARAYDAAATRLHAEFAKLNGV